MGDKTVKEAKLRPDEFNPSKEIKSFWRLPRQIARIENLSMGAKLLYAVLMGMSGTYGTAYPTKETLRKHLGNVSTKTLYNWQRELVAIKLIRVHQKGRGLPNNYYFLRSSVLRNDPEHETIFDDFTVYKVKGVGPTASCLIATDPAKRLFNEQIIEWFEQQKQGNSNYPFPTPMWKCSQAQYEKWERAAEAKLAEYFRQQSDDYAYGSHSTVDTQ